VQIFAQMIAQQPWQVNEDYVKSNAGIYFSSVSSKRNKKKKILPSIHFYFKAKPYFDNQPV